MLLGMTAETDEREKPPFETPFKAPFETQGRQGPLTGASLSQLGASKAGQEVWRPSMNKIRTLKTGGCGTHESTCSRWRGACW